MPLGLMFCWWRSQFKSSKKKKKKSRLCWGPPCPQEIAKLSRTKQKSGTSKVNPSKAHLPFLLLLCIKKKKKSWLSLVHVMRYPYNKMEPQTLSISKHICHFLLSFLSFFLLAKGKTLCNSNRTIYIKWGEIPLIVLSGQRNKSKLLLALLGLKGAKHSQEYGFWTQTARGWNLFLHFPPVGRKGTVLFLRFLICKLKVSTVPNSSRFCEKSLNS